MEKSVTGQERNILVIPASHEDAVRISEFQLHEGVEHLDAENATVGVITQKDHIEVVPSNAETVEIFLFIEPFERGDERLHISVKVAVEENLCAGAEVNFLCEGFEFRTIACFLEVRA